MTVSDLKNYLWICDDTQDRVLNILLESSISSINNYIWRDILLSEREELYNGNAQRELCLKNYPVVTIDNISYNFWSNDVPVRVEVPPSDYTVKLSNWTVYFSNHLTRWFNNYKFVYTAWYDPLPSDIKLCILKTAARYYNSMSSDWIKWETVNWDRIDFDTSSMPNDVMMLLSKYRDI